MLNHSLSSSFKIFHYNLNLINIVFKFLSVSLDGNSGNFIQAKSLLSKDCKQQLLN